MEHNPYAAPQAAVVDVVPEASQELASRGLRLGGAIIDGLIVGAVVLAVMFAVGLGAFASGVEQTGLIAYVLSAVLGFGIFVAIQGYFLHSTGQTIAKKLLRMRIVDENGEKPEFFRMLGLRYAVFQFVQMIPLLGVAVGLTNALFIFRDDRRCLHDLLAGTRVVMES